MSEYLTTVWSGSGGAFSLSCMPGPGSTAALAAAEGDHSRQRVETPPMRRGRGYRAEGHRLRDVVLTIVPRPPKRLFLREVCARLESTGQKDVEQISRALLTLLAEGKVGRERVAGRWQYWRV